MSLAAPDTLCALDAALRRGPSATLVLEDWCRARGIIGRMRIRRLDRAGDAAPPDPTGLMQVAQPRYRRIRMFCGEFAVSEAENWYDAAALDAQMNRALDETDTPFGLVVAPLRFQRRFLSARLAEGRLEHRAALYAAEGATPFCVVVERYGDVPS